MSSVQGCHCPLSPRKCVLEKFMRTFFDDILENISEDTFMDMLDILLYFWLFMC